MSSRTGSIGATGSGTARVPGGTVAALVALIIGVGLLAAILWGGAPVTEAIIAKMGGATVSVPAGDTIFNLVVFGTMILVAGIGGMIARVNPFVPGRRPSAMLPLGLLVGLFGVTVTTGYSIVAGTLVVGDPVATTTGLLLWGGAVVLLQAASEEIFFRGWLQPLFERTWGAAPAIVIGAIAFAGLHVLGGARAPLTLVNLFLGGMLFGLLAALSRGVLAPIAAHFAWNGAEQLLLGLDPNPGVGSFGSVINFELQGTGSWGGSEEGLNASFAMTLTLLAILIPLVLATRRHLADNSRGVQAPNKFGTTT